MKKLLMIALSLSAFSTVAHAASPAMLCKLVKPVEYESYYIKKEIAVRIDAAKKAAFLRLHDVGDSFWTDGGYSAKVAAGQNGYTVYSGFGTEEIFGDLSEGEANLGIYLYVSAEVQAGKAGKVSLYAKGSEVGFEKAEYTCAVAK